MLTYAQVCGRYLFLNKLTHERTALMINAMLRLKAHKNLDNRYNTMIENAYYICRPAVQSARAKRKVRDIVVSICLSVCLSVCLSIYLAMYLSFYRSIYLAIYLSMYPSISM